MSIRKYETFKSREVLPIRDLVYEDDWHPNTTTPQYKPLNAAHVKALYNTFEANGCRRNENPILVRAIDGRYVCLDGKHRLEAGKMHLAQDDQCWPGLVFETHDAVLLEYLRSSNAVLEPNSDGDIYRIACYYESKGDARLANSWKEKTTKGKRRFMQFLDNAKVSGVVSLAEYMRRLWPYPGLWTNFKLGLHRIESSRCHEEVAYYLDLIYQFWLQTCGDEPHSATIYTVQKLEGRYPELSSDDSTRIAEAFEDFTVFEKVQNKAKRNMIRSRCLNNQGRILSLTLFMEDTKLLSLASDAMKLLLPERFKHSIRAMFKDCFERAQMAIEGSNDTFDTAYRKLWLDAWQNFPQLVTSRNLCLRKGHSGSRFQLSPTKVADFAKYSTRLGFGNISDRPSPILAHENLACLTQSIESFLRSFCQDRTYQCDDMKAAVQAISRNVEAFLEATQPVHIEEARLTQNISQLRADDRMGLPHEASFDDDRTSLLLYYIYQKPPIIRPGKNYVSSFGILRDQFRCFFGTALASPPLNIPEMQTGIDFPRSLESLGLELSPIQSVSDAASRNSTDVTFWDAPERLEKRPLPLEDQSDLPNATRIRVD
ncbi:hypothetical protein M409DRAFT_30728 [Zasmidium cellare ATCC 36951]|uniref:ParB/Sulfiredoxin domain-containing protein n=1 Tax=Zasmidium cellare ATCC 36951 TaxID=1080233 RepID=A0A6A6BXW1_ZASCE|nr:uncharacterized protein M409DRAFT_30728 [Zasmidium cellare ATCC 36951]KAF2158770.1 hypothetical protein M409DRAFT_30728 [Zasmidium cellare ATCC 36951]